MSDRTQITEKSSALVNIRLRLRAWQMFVEVGQAFDFGYVRVVDAVPALCAGPFAFPILRIEERIFDLERLAAIDQAHALDDVEILADRNAGVDPVAIGNHGRGIADKRVAVPRANRF